MATQPRRNLNIGTIIDRTVDVFSKNIVAGLAFIVVFAALGSTTDFLSQGAPIRAALFSLIVGLASIFGSYFLAVTMLRKDGLMAYQGPPRLLPFLGLGILTGIATVLGFLLFVIPGLILMARWSIAGSTLIAEGRPITDSMSESWEKTRGSELPIIVSIVLLVFLFAIVSALAPRYFDDIGISAILLGRVAGSISSVISVSAGVAIYSLLNRGN